MKSTKVPEEVLESMNKIVEMFIPDEERHWEEDPIEEHIYHDLELVGRFLENLKSEDF